MRATKATAATLFGNYRVTHTLGEGGMGKVFAAEHVLIGKPAAVKVLHGYATSDPELVQRFFREARVASQIGHPGIVDVYDFGHTEDGGGYLVMERLQGQALSDRLAKAGALDVAQSIAIALQVADVLEATHKACVVHRDLKPDNVFLVPDSAAVHGERVKVLDFGIAKLSGDDSDVLTTQTGVVMGSPLYMAPEQCAGAKSVDHRVDVYSLGCMLFEMICGRPPFEGKGMVEVITAHLYTDPPLPREFCPSLTAEVEAVILGALAKSADQRYGSMTEFAEALRASCSDVPSAFADTAVRPQTWPAHTAERATVDSMARRAGGETLGPPRPTVPWPLFVILAACIVLATAAAANAVLGDGEPSAPNAVKAQPLVAPLEPIPGGEMPQQMAANTPQSTSDTELAKRAWVDSQPPARIYLPDGAFLGTTPAVLDPEVVGAHRFVLLRGPRRETQKVDIEWGTCKQVSMRSVGHRAAKANELAPEDRSIDPYAEDLPTDPFSEDAP